MVNYSLIIFIDFLFSKIIFFTDENIKGGYRNLYIKNTKNETVVIYNGRRFLYPIFFNGTNKT